ncbi:MAG: bifunctional [glutamate--ammonia ligase]-adenylyl-L-tyrosine phosphorylase/[glutamate--ammonia-ligase] adenylyltransferase [Planctomycetes bacterium]|nr:bifunctional [glutamate--ammonia ligase]-adenylyl-L-tyrosine phosphorylase/[glutamate--ammonia-ligase] adenylyltransferase [Planctomycetota bacterium]
MDAAQLHQLLDQPDEAADWLRSLGLTDIDRAHGNLVRMATAGVTLDLLGNICEQLALALPAVSDPDMALNNLERFVAAAGNPLSLGTLFERDPTALPVLLQIFSTSQYLSDLLIVDPSGYDLLRMTDGRPVAREMLVEELCGEIEVLDDERMVLAALRRFKRRETLRISYGDIVHGQSLETVTRQISYLADAIIEAALLAARRKLEAKRGQPLRPDGQPARFVVLALGKLGGTELNYSSDIDLILLYDEDGKTDGKTDGKRQIANSEFFAELTRQLVKLLSVPTELGSPYRVDLRLRPEGKLGPLVSSLQSARHYYDVLGRTWERQAYVKARPVAGDLNLGAEFLSEMTPWIYRNYLSRADISGIKALKRRIEHRAHRKGINEHDVKTGHGGIRDIEFVIQFLQLLNGGDLPNLRTGNTLEAIAQLEQARCLTDQERNILEENYRFLRKIEHRLQIMLDLQTHAIPDDPAEKRKLAIRLGYSDTEDATALAAFEADYQQRTQLNRKILDHLLHDAFEDDGEAAPEVDLVLDPDPSDEDIREVLGRYPFKDIPAAYHHLMDLGEERIRFLSTRRCRHFLASIATALLEAISATPDPDATLLSLSKVSDSVGGKGVLWELFSFNPPTLHLYVELCASAPYLADILISNPGMIDELLDSLLLGKLPTSQWLDETISELCRGAEDIDPILHSFKNAQHLRIGVLDILGKEDIQATNAALSDIAQACLRQVVSRQYDRLIEKLGQPTIGEGPRAGEPCEPIIVGMGKFGGREPNYHSDLDLIFLYEDDGPTVVRRRGEVEKKTTNQHFFGELGQRIIKVANHLGPYGRLYEVDARLRPSGRSGSLATSIDGLLRYFTSGDGQDWERQALCKARVVVGSPQASQRTMKAIRRAIFHKPWQSETAAEIRHMRKRLEDTASKRNLKRGPGGIVDVEFLVQLLQLKYGQQKPEVCHYNTLDALAALNEAGCLSDDDHAFLAESYRFLRGAEARLRIMNASGRHELPEDEQELATLAGLLKYSDAAALLADARRYTSETRRRFDRITQGA